VGNGLALPWAGLGMPRTTRGTAVFFAVRQFRVRNGIDDEAQNAKAALSSATFSS